MYAARAAKPKLSLSIATASTSNTSRPVLSLKSPVAMSMSMPPRTPLSPSPLSPTARNTKLNQRGFSTMQQQATFAYANAASSKSILKKNSSFSSASSSSSSPSSGASSKRIQFICEPTVHCVTPIENGEDYYGGYVKMSRDERRWMLRS
ncbi:hypothetical protein EMCG_02209 [[Emmonsia] crescens]|uniref:Uncharacterized protein n=1 Tax=[Emmonsia] crescens TaxID=73230 RepID=A0A0G2HZF4_9EURO|nr:hypothetical protein EMCG_02209 [Emmonsia crescens UAMH 3008]